MSNSYIRLGKRLISQHVNLILTRHHVRYFSSHGMYDPVCWTCGANNRLSNACPENAFKAKLCTSCAKHHAPNAVCIGKSVSGVYSSFAGSANKVGLCLLSPPTTAGDEVGMVITRISKRIRLTAAIDNAKSVVGGELADRHRKSVCRYARGKIHTNVWSFDKPHRRTTGSTNGQN